MGLLDSLGGLLGGTDDAGVEAVEDPAEPPVPVERIREVADDAAGAGTDLDLDFSAASLDELDAAAARRDETFASFDDADALIEHDAVLVMGAYFGETLIRIHGGRWRYQGGWSVHLGPDDDVVEVPAFEVAARSLAGDPTFATVAESAARGLADDPSGPSDAKAADDADAGASDAATPSATVDSDAETPDDAGATDTETPGDEAAGDGPIAPEVPAEGLDGPQQPSASPRPFEIPEGDTPGQPSASPRPTDRPPAGPTGERSGPKPTDHPAASADDPSEIEPPREQPDTPVGQGDVEAETAVTPPLPPDPADLHPATVAARYREAGKYLVETWPDRGLDGSVVSLAHLDDLLAADAAAVEERSGQAAVAGYFAEVLRWEHDAAWRCVDDEALLVLAGRDDTVDLDPYKLAGAALDGDLSFVEAYAAAAATSGVKTPL